MAATHGRRLERVGSFATLLMLALLAASTLLLARLASLPIRAPEPLRPSELAAKAQLVVITTTAGSGSVRARLVAESLEVRQDDSIELMRPVLLMTQEGRPEPTRLSALTGHLSADQSELLLRSEVRLTREGADALTVETKSLRVLLEQQIAETDAPVVATRNGQRLSGVGMRLDERVGVLQLLSASRLEIPAAGR